MINGKNESKLKILTRNKWNLKEILDEFLSEVPDRLDSGLDLSDLDSLTPD